VLSSSDALELGRLTDGVVLVATVGHSSRGQLVQAARALTGVQVPVLGVVLDGVSESAQRAGGPSASKASISSRPARGRGVDAP
jgi:Mrp family chromosome partitioning ATPase